MSSDHIFLINHSAELNHYGGNVLQRPTTQEIMTFPHMFQYELTIFEFVRKKT